MNLQPVHPAPKTPMRLQCSRCNKVKDHTEIKADLDAPGGTFVCDACAPAPFDQVSFIMAFENGELSNLEVVDGFAELLKTGICWQLQGFYGRTATTIISMGYLNRDGSHGPNYDDLES